MSAQLGVWQSRTLRRWGARAKQQQGISLLQASILSGRTKRATAATSRNLIVGVSAGSVLKGKKMGGPTTAAVASYDAVRRLMHAHEYELFKIP
jgi:hypothetical protein